MTLTTRRLASAGAGVLAVALSCSTLPASQAAPAPAPAKRFGVVASLGDGTIEACRRQVRDGRAWKIFVRVDNRQGSVRVRGKLVVRKEGMPRQRVRTGPVRVGQRSDVLSIVVVKGGGSALAISLDGREAGVGVGMSVPGVRPC